MSVQREIVRQAAYQLHGEGWHVVLCCAGTKVALFKDWTTPREWREIDFYLRKYDTNVAVLLKDAVVIDQDGPTDPWPEVRSPMEVLTSRGKHRYFTIPDTVKEVRTKIKLLPGIDILMGKRYAIVPPSLMADTDYRYAYAPGTGLVAPNELPELPAEIVKLLNENAHLSAATLSEIPPAADERLIRYVDRIDPSIQGSNGSRQCIVVCLKILTLIKGDIDRAWALLVRWNKRCQPPWDEEREDGPDSLKRKLQEAHRFWKAR